MRRDEPPGNGPPALPEIVRRAAEILAQQASMRNSWPASGPAALQAGGRPVPSSGPVLSMDELRQRALQLLTDFFNAFGPISDLQTALMAALPGVPAPAVWPGAAQGGQSVQSPFSATPSTLPAAVAALPAVAPLASGLSTLVWQSAQAPTPAGQSVKLPLQAENRQNKPVQASYYSSDLLSDHGYAIPSYQVSFEPPNFTVRPGERSPVSARIEIPLQTVPGAYSGLVQAAGLPDSKAVITIHVV